MQSPWPTSTITTSAGLSKKGKAKRARPALPIPTAMTRSGGSAIARAAIARAGSPLGNAIRLPSGSPQGCAARASSFTRGGSGENAHRATAHSRNPAPSTFASAETGAHAPGISASAWTRAAANDAAHAAPHKATPCQGAPQPRANAYAREAKTQHEGHERRHTSTLDSGAMSGNCAKAPMDAGSVASVAASVAASNSQSLRRRPPVHELQPRGDERREHDEAEDRQDG